MLQDESFIRNLLESNKELMGVGLISEVINSYISKPLHKKYNDNFVKFLIDFTDQEKAEYVPRLIFRAASEMFKKEIFNQIS